MTHSKGSYFCSKLLYPIFYYHTLSDAICESRMRQYENQFFLQEGKLEHLQHQEFTVTRNI
jgi:hypothetical protein